jgi:nitrogen fixation protein NifQ
MLRLHPEIQVIMMPRPIDYHWLMSYAADPEDGVVRAFAGVIDRASRERGQAPNLAMGLSQEHFAELLDRYYPGVRAALYGAICKTHCNECTKLQAEEFDDLVQLLLDHRANESQQTEWLAYAIASGCMGGNHLYEDMGLPNRQALSDLLNRHFTTLFVKNAGNMKWKKFFYKQLCDRAQVQLCKAPSCQVCTDIDACFGPEDDSGLAALARLGQDIGC